MTSDRKRNQKTDKAQKQKKAAKTAKSKVPAKKGAAKLAQKPRTGKHPGGRPPKFKTPEELQAKIEAYFGSCWEDKVTEVTDKDGKVTMSTVHYQDRPYTVAGLAWFLGFEDRHALSEYKARPEFSAIVKKAMLKIQTCWEEYLMGKNAAGPIFWLKNHAGYKDKQEYEHTGKDGGPIVTKATDATDEELLNIARGGGARAPKKA